ncbi:MAG TPA: zf-HC2 domain-containing protein [bacterium]|nr:zf-HC2 domain-containing protein [bacterium]HPR86992.1 zf-HC2 domain-containing protein [bacterium]
MNCRETQKRISAYLDGELEPAPHRGVAEHLDTCAACRRRKVQLERLYLLLQPGELPAPDSAMVFRVRAALGRVATAGTRRLQIVFRLLIPVSVAAGLLLGVVLGQTLSTHWSAPTQSNQENFEAKLITQVAETPLTASYLDLSWSEGGVQ